MISKSLTPESHRDAAHAAVADLRDRCREVGPPSVGAVPGPETQPDLPGVLSDDAIDDWGEQFSAVTTRLRLMVDGRYAAMPDETMNAAERGFQAGMLQCVAALDQLRLTMRHDFDRRRITPPSRTDFLERLSRMLAEPETPQRALLCIDLDDFNAIKRDHGHEVGNELLRVVAVRLARSVRAEDIVARLQGDEFACLLGDLPHREQLSDLACKLFLELSTPLDLGHLRLSVRPSLGIALWPADGATADALLGKADAAKKRAKREATGYAFFNESDDPSAYPPACLSSSHSTHFGDLDA